jgi:hypothetical protein
MIDIFMLIRRLLIKKLQLIINIALLLIVCYKLVILFTFKQQITFQYRRDAEINSALNESIRFPWTRSTIYRNG